MKTYKENVVKAAEILMRIGIKPDSSSSLRDSVEEVLNKLTKEEINLYGQIPTKEQILEEIKEKDALLHELREQDPELYDQTPSKQQILEAIKKNDREIAQLELKKAQIKEKIALIKAKQG